MLVNRVFRELFDLQIGNIVGSTESEQTLDRGALIVDHAVFIEQRKQVRRVKRDVS